MKALVLEEYMQLNYRDFEEPEIESNEVLVQVKACGICGSDVHGMDGSTGRRKPPLVMGHEASGTIAKTGKDVSDWQVGDRVTFDSTIYQLEDWYTRKGRYNLSDNRKVLGVSPGEYRKHGAFAEYVSVPAHILYKIPDNVSFEQAAMVEPVAVAAHAVNISKIQPGASALVIGAGMVGMFVLNMLKIAGANPIIALDLDENKLELAKEFGATHTFNTSKPGISEKIKELTKTRGADFGFEVVGISETVNLCINNLRKGGTAVLVGNLKPEVTIPLQKVVTTELSLLGSCAINGEYELVLDLLASGKINVDKMISAKAPLSEGAFWFKRLYNKEPGLNKVILVP
ncbi:alcohol dehydrogenase catalytic domain-containing protein [Maribellus comscasis]|uniref:Alcohol dehydrogenase catalytic domain-containing protein n=1 Tax=Maribellus comscasis TaxID=2681766 RepID=A0A6I6JS61_9BACT|nr:galactitol-1-phosphate 5-dehydrogenase [Maribellus comscasis]QGY44069.1 alcohol dehydrogenase catalytic domain-containing protein [Maribellus comscasis]